jgi:hypothetical protein
MTIQELIEELSKYESSTEVIVSGYEGGYNTVCGTDIIQIVKNVNTEWYYGAHEEVGMYRTDNSTEPSVPAVLIGGSRC